jgi:hypothetical protein
MPPSNRQYLLELFDPKLRFSFRRDHKPSLAIIEKYSARFPSKDPKRSIYALLRQLVVSGYLTKTIGGDWVLSEAHKNGIVGLATLQRQEE